MAQQPQPHPEPTRSPDGAWREEEKTRGAGTDPAAADAAGAAGEAAPKGGPSDDRAKTEGAAARIQGEPDPDAPVGGGHGPAARLDLARRPGQDGG